MIKTKNLRDRRFFVLLLLSEVYSLLFGVHGIDDSKRLKVITEISDASAAKLESLFDNDSDSLDRSTGGLGNRDKPLKRTAVCKEVVDYK